MRVLIVEDEADHREFLATTVNEWHHEVLLAEDGEEALAILGHSQADVILSDLMMPKMDGFELLRQLRSQGELPPTILMTAFGSLEKALHTIHELDGFWYLEKPIDPKALQLLLGRAGAHRRLAIENESLRRELSFTGVLGNLIGQTRQMQEVFALLRQVSPTSAAVMLTGESGTGKELAARAIHTNSRRSGGPFIAINCAALPEGLIESEIFGHEKGAFTGAVERRAGALELAQGGTLFLDEMGEMPLPMQAKLLRVLEDLRFRRLGGKQEHVADVRVVAATNRDPLVAIKEGKLREDLYYRLNVFQIHLPPLRERKEDIPLIVETMVATMNQKHGTKVQGASQSFLDTLSEFTWEGNVRELRNVIERAVIVAGEGSLQPHHIAAGKKRAPEERAGGSAGTATGIGVEVGMTIDDAERLLIEATLSHSNNNKTRAAAILGISTKTLHAKVRQYNPDYDSKSEEALSDAAR